MHHTKNLCRLIKLAAKGGEKFKQMGWQMQSFLKLGSCGLLLLSCGSATEANAAGEGTSATKTIDALTSCRTVADSQERLACYDRATDTIIAARTRKDLIVMDKAEVRETRKGLFGFSLPKVRIFGKDDDTAEADLSDVTLKITSVRDIGFGKWRFAVENGGVWETTEAHPRFKDPKVGESVLIEKGALNGYFAKIGKGHRVSAKRIQ
jgi:hypothetical protein